MIQHLDNVQIWRRTWQHCIDIENRLFNFATKYKTCIQRWVNIVWWRGCVGCEQASKQSPDPKKSTVLGQRPLFWNSWIHRALDVLVHTCLVENKVLNRIPVSLRAKISKPCTRKGPTLKPYPFFNFCFLFLQILITHNSRSFLVLWVKQCMFNSEGVNLNSQSRRVSLRLYMYVHTYVSVFTVKLRFMNVSNNWFVTAIVYLMHMCRLKQNVPVRNLNSGRYVSYSGIFLPPTCNINGIHHEYLCRMEKSHQKGEYFGWGTSLALLHIH